MLLRAISVVPPPIAATCRSKEVESLLGPRIVGRGRSGLRTRQVERDVGRAHLHDTADQSAERGAVLGEHPGPHSDGDPIGERAAGGRAPARERLDDLLVGHRTFQSGSRFSRKAFAPSWASSVTATFMR